MALKRIFSAGGIVLRPIRQAQGLRLAPLAQDKSKNKIEVLVTQHSKHKGWDFPKGHIEEGESMEQAALREVREETGVRAEIVEKAGSTQYFYWDQGEKVFKTVTFYLMKYVGEGEATTAFEVLDKKWLPPEKVRDQLTFEDTKKMWDKVKGKVEQLTTDN